MQGQQQARGAQKAIWGLTRGGVRYIRLSRESKMKFRFEPALRKSRRRCTVPAGPGLRSARRFRRQSAPARQQYGIEGQQGRQDLGRIRWTLTFVSGGYSSGIRRSEIEVSNNNVLEVTLVFSKIVLWLRVLPLALILTPGTSSGGSCYTTPCRLGYPGVRIHYNCGIQSGEYFSCCPFYDWVWASGRCYQDAQCGPGSWACYSLGDDGIYRTFIYCCTQ